MDWILSEEESQLLGDAKEFAQEQLAGELRTRDQDAIFDRRIWEKCGEKGILGAHVGTEWGGGGRSALETVLLMEGVGYGTRDNGLALAIGGQIWSVVEPIEIFGSEAQKKKYLPKLISGEWVGAHGVSEEKSGSDALSLETRAEKVEGGYILNGKKCFIGMASECDVALVLVKTDESLGSWGLSAFLVDKGTKGFSLSKPRGKMGTRTNPMGDLLLENCFVSDEQRLGEEGIGMSLFTQTMTWERAFIHAGHLGSMARLLEDCVKYAQERQQFGKPIGSYQAISHRIAEMKTRQDTSRLLLYQVARLKDEGKSGELACSVAKLHISESLLASSVDAVRIHGARGYLEEYEVERELRDHTSGVIYAGTSDIQKNLIAQLLGV